MPEQSPIVESPTGTPRMPPERVPFWLVLGIVLASGFTAAGQLLPEQYALARIICTVLGIAVGAGVGTVSPGLRRHGGTLLVLFAVGLSLTGCAVHQHARPVPGAIGKPGPVACVAAKEARKAWLAYAEPYIRATFEAQEAYSCGPVVSAAPPVAVAPE